MDAQFVLTVITAILGSGAISALVSGVMANRKTKAEVVSIERTVEQKAIELARETYENLIKSLNERSKECDARIEALELETASQEEKINFLAKQVAQLREINSGLLEKNDALQGRIKICEDYEKLFKTNGE